MPTPRQTLLLALVTNAIGIGFFFLPFEIQYIGWILLLIGSIILFFAGYLWFNDMITKLAKKASK